MYCDHCGNPNPDGSAFCATCGASLAPSPRAPSSRSLALAPSSDGGGPYDPERPLAYPGYDGYGDDPYGYDDYGVPESRPYPDSPPYDDPYGFEDPYHEDDPYRAQYLSQQQYRAEHGYQTLGSPGPRGRGPIPEEADGPIREHRSLGLYIGLSILTLGIYGWYCVHCMARDANVLCAADGERTTGLGLYLLFSFLTLNIYSFYWIYRLAQRLYDNAPAYGLRFEWNGLIVLLWNTVGLLLIVGPFIAMHRMFRELDELSRVYNERYAFTF